MDSDDIMDYESDQYDSYDDQYGDLSENDEFLKEFDKEFGLVKIRYEIKSLRHELEQEKKDRVKQNLELLKEIGDLKAENLKFRDALDYQESRGRKNNIMIFGVPENEHSAPPEDIVREICSDIHVQINPNEITEAYRVGRNKGNRPICCKVATFKKKSEIMYKNKQQGHLAILHDLTKKERNDKKRLQSRLVNARHRGMKAHVRNGKLIVNNISFTEAEYDEHIGNIARRPDVQQPQDSRRAPPQSAAGRENRSPPSERPPPKGHVAARSAETTTSAATAQQTPRDQRAAARSAEKTARVAPPPPPTTARKIAAPATQPALRARAAPPPHSVKTTAKAVRPPPPPRQTLAAAAAARGGCPVTGSTSSAVKMKSQRPQINKKSCSNFRDIPNY